MSGYNFIQLVSTGENFVYVPVVHPTLLVINAPNGGLHNDPAKSFNKSKDKTKLRPIAIRREAAATCDNDGKIYSELLF